MVAVALGRVDLQQDRLRQRDQPGPRQPLQGPEEDEFPKAGGGAAQRRSEREAGDRGQEHVFDPEAAGEPAGQRHHDGAAHDIGGQRPGDLVERSRQAALDVR